MRWRDGLFWAIDEIAWHCGRIGGDLLRVTGGDIFLQSLQQSEDLHAGRHLADPDVAAGLQFFHVSLHTKVWMLHEIGGQESPDSLDHPGMCRHIPVTHSEFDHFYCSLFIHQLSIAGWNGKTLAFLQLAKPVLDPPRACM